MSDDLVTLRSVLVSLWNERWIILTLTLLGAALGVAYALTRESQYESRALLASAKDGASQMAAISGLIGQFSGLASALGINAGGGTSMEEAVAVLLSKEFSSRFILRHGLLPLLVPEVSATEPGPATDGSSGDDRGHQMQSGAVVGLERAVERFDRIRRVKIDRRTGFVELSLRAPTPERARSLAEDMIAEINSDLRGRALREAENSIKLLQQRMSETPYESVRAAAASLLEMQLKQEVMIRSRDDFALRVIDPPNLPEQRAYPHRKRMVIVAAILGFMGAIGALLLRRAWRGYKAIQRAG